MKQFNLMHDVTSKIDQSNKLAVPLFIQVTVLFLMIGLMTGYTFAELDRMNVNVKKALSNDPAVMPSLPSKDLHKINTDVNIVFGKISV